MTYEHEQLAYENGQLKDENVFFSKLIDKMKGNQAKQSTVGTDNKRVAELEEKLANKTKQHDQIKEKYDRLFADLNEEKDRKDSLLKENSALKNSIIQKDAELLKSKTDKFIRDKIGEKTKPEEK